MTEAERELMQRHAIYWQAMLDKGFVLVFGPVFDPKGPYGAGIANLVDDAAARSFAADDPRLRPIVGSRMTSVPWQLSPEKHNQVSARNSWEQSGACRRTTQLLSVG